MAHRPLLLQTLRRLSLGWLGRAVLLAWALSLGVAVASPWVNPQASQWVCAANGLLQWVVGGSDSGQTMGSGSMDCPLCSTATAPGGPAPVALATPAGAVLAATAFASEAPSPHALRPQARAPPFLL